MVLAAGAVAEPLIEPAGEAGEKLGQATTNALRGALGKEPLEAPAIEITRPEEGLLKRTFWPGLPQVSAPVPSPRNSRALADGSARRAARAKGWSARCSAGLGFGKTLGEGLNDDAAALGAATDQALEPVAKRLPQSDAELGPLSRLTAAGAAIPATLAEGVTLGTGTLTDAFGAMLATISGTTSPTLTPEPGPLAAPVPAAPTLAPPEPLVAPALIPAPLAPRRRLPRR